MQWTDRIRQVKIILVSAAAVICAVSLAWSHFLVRDLQREERVRMEIWAEAMRQLNQADEQTDLALVLTVLNGNNTIPVIVLDRDGIVHTFRNLDIDAATAADSTAFILSAARSMQADGKVVRLDLGGQE